jgi:hypothetical protein
MKWVGVRKHGNLLPMPRIFSLHVLGQSWVIHPQDVSPSIFHERGIGIDVLRV